MIKLSAILGKYKLYKPSSILRLASQIFPLLGTYPYYDFTEVLPLKLCNQKYNINLLFKKNSNFQNLILSILVLSYRQILLKIKSTYKNLSYIRSNYIIIYNINTVNCECCGQTTTTRLWIRSREKESFDDT